MKFTLLSTVIAYTILASMSIVEASQVHDAVHDLFKQQVSVGDDVDFMLPTYNDRHLQEVNTGVFNKKTFQITDSHFTDDNLFHAMNVDGESIHLIRAKGANGQTVVIGSIVSPVDDVVYEIYLDDNGKSQIRATNSADFRPEGLGDDDEAFEHKDGTSEASAAEKTPSDITSPIEVVDSSKPISLRGNDPNRRLQTSVIDIMIAWSPYAECSYAGKSAGCTLTNTTTSNMQTKIALAISETNQIYANSGISAKLRLVYSYRLDGYTESNCINTLNNAVNPSDGVLDDLHTNRAKYGADLVQVWIVDPTSCGQGAYNTPNAGSAYMFSAVAYDCATGYYSVAHEIGHNMGCNHDRGNLNQCTAGGYNFGYKNKTNKRRDVMAVECQTGQCDQNPYSSCTRVAVYSTPSTTKFGTMGNSQNNCAAMIKATAPTVAGFFPTLV